MTLPKPSEPWSRVREQTFLEGLCSLAKELLCELHVMTRGKLPLSGILDGPWGCVETLHGLGFFS